MSILVVPRTCTEKPHLFRHGDEWACADSTFVGVGANPRAAWVQWRLLSLQLGAVVKKVQ